MPFPDGFLFFSLGSWGVEVEGDSPGHLLILLDKMHTRAFMFSFLCGLLLRNESVFAKIGPGVKQNLPFLF